MTTNKSKTLKTLTISRKRWLTAKDIDKKNGLYSMLYRSKDRKMCCLGFLGRACGGKAADLSHQFQPSDVPSIQWPSGMISACELAPWESGPSFNNSEFVYDMMKANDNKELTQREREKEIKRLFKKHLNITVKFVP